MRIKIALHSILLMAAVVVCFIPIENELYTETKTPVVEKQSTEWEHKLETKVPVKYQKLAFKYGKKYGIDYPLVVAIIEVESGGKADSISATKDYGLMQINECNHKWLKDSLGLTDLMNAKQNIKAGCYMLMRLYKSYDDTRLVLMEYNMGNYALELWDDGIKETEYSKKVLEAEKRMVEAILNED